MEDAQNGGPGLGVLAIIALVVMVLCLIVSLLVGGTVLLYGVVTSGDSAETTTPEIEDAPTAEDSEAEATEEAAGESDAEGESDDADGGEETGSLPYTLTFAA